MVIQNYFAEILIDCMSQIWLLIEPYMNEGRNEQSESLHCVSIDSRYLKPHDIPFRCYKIIRDPPRIEEVDEEILVKALVALGKADWRPSTILKGMVIELLTPFMDVVAKMTSVFKCKFDYTSIFIKEIYNDVVTNLTSDLESTYRELHQDQDFVAFSSLINEIYKKVQLHIFLFKICNLKSLFFVSAQVLLISIPTNLYSTNYNTYIHIYHL